MVAKVEKLFVGKGEFFGKPLARFQLSRKSPR
jgi:hypothetical protein